MAPTSRRRALQSIGTCLGLGLGSCLGTPSGGTGTGTDAPTSTDTSTPAGATPRYSPLVLEIRNRTDEVLLVGVTPTEWTDASATGSPGDVLYDETVEMASPETLDLKPYRIDAAMRFRLSAGSTVLFEDVVTPYGGYRISIYSTTDVEVETVIV